MIYALIDKDTVIKYPVNLQLEFPNTSFSDNPSQESLIDFKVVIIKESPTPDFNAETETIEELEPVYIDGQWIQQWKVTSKI